MMLFWTEFGCVMMCVVGRAGIVFGVCVLVVCFELVLCLNVAHW